MIVVYGVVFFLGAVAAYAFRLLPEKWLCDYDETPSPQHAASCRALSAGTLVLWGFFLTLCVWAASRTVLQSVSGAWAQLVLLVLAANFAVLMLAAFCDWRYKILPDELLALSGLLSVCLWGMGAFRAVFSVWYSPVVGAAAGFFGLWAVGSLSAKLHGSETMGFGDVKLLGVLGLLCGIGGLGAAVLAAVCSAAAIFAILLACRLRSREDMVPFGPFLVGGAFLWLCLRPECIALGQWYLSFF